MTRLESGSIVGSSEVNACRMYIEDRGISNIEIVPFNDDWDPGKAVIAFHEARKSGIDILITSHISTCAVAISGLVNRDHVLMFVTGATTDALSARDDYIIRNIPDVGVEQRSIAGYMNGLAGAPILLIRDIDNDAYTTPALGYFHKYNRKPLAGIIDISISRLDVDSLFAEMRGTRFQIVYIMVGGYRSSAGSIAQIARKINPGTKIIFTPWIKTPALLETLGDAVENAIVPSHYPPKGQNRAVDEYIMKFKKRFGYAPTFISLNVYSALEILSRAIAAGHTTPEAIKSYILAAKKFDTEFGPVVFDAYGDAAGDLYFITDLTKEF